MGKVKGYPQERLRAQFATFIRTNARLLTAVVTFLLIIVGLATFFIWSKSPHTMLTGYVLGAIHVGAIASIFYTLLADKLSAYGQVVVDECHHVAAAAFETAVRAIPARYWVGLTATPYRRDGLDDLIGFQLGAVRHTFTHADVVDALGRGRHCLVLAQRTGHVDHLAAALTKRAPGYVSLGFPDPRKLA